jgi:cellulose synthase operon protein C
VIACGPAYLRSAGLEEWLARRVAELTDDAAADGGGAGSAELRRLRSSFSELATAFTLCAQNHFDQALVALREIPRRPLGDLPGDCAGLAADPGHVLAGCEACGAFLRRNPAYALLPGRWRAFQLDAVFHAVFANLNIAHTELASGPDGLDAAMAHLGDAMETARDGARSARTREAVTRMILGRAESLRRAEGPRRGDRLSEGIALVERGLAVAGDREKARRELSVMLSDLLTSRGVWYSVEAPRDHGIEPEYGKAEADQRHAFQCNPNSVNARNNFARRLIYNLSSGSAARWGPADLGRILESLHLVHNGLLQAGEHPLLLETLNEVLVRFERYLTAHATMEEVTSLASARPDDPADPGQPAAGIRAQWRLCARVRRDRMDGATRLALIDAIQDLLSAAGGGRRA